MLRRSVVWGSGKCSFQAVVPRQLGTAKRYFLVESTESLNFRLSLSKASLHLHIRLFKVHDMGSSYEEEVSTASARAGLESEPRSRRETLLLFWLETGKTSFSLAYPSRSSSLRRCSASIRCLLVASFLVLARCSARETLIIGSSSSEIE